MSIGPMVPLTTTASPFAARVLAARLGAEGIVWELRGNVEGPYPVGPVEVLVSADDLPLARELVGEHGAGDDQAGTPPAADPAPRALWLLLGAVVLAAAVLLARLVVLG